MSDEQQCAGGVADVNIGGVPYPEGITGESEPAEDSAGAEGTADQGDGGSVTEGAAGDDTGTEATVDGTATEGTAADGAPDEAGSEAGSDADAGADAAPDSGVQADSGGDVE